MKVYIVCDRSYGSELRAKVVGVFASKEKAEARALEYLPSICPYHKKVVEMGIIADFVQVREFEVVE